MIAALASPLARWGALAAAVAALALWAMAERGGRLSAVAAAAEARREAAGLRERIRTMEVRRHEDDRATRDPDPVRSLRDEWTRPD